MEPTSREELLTQLREKTRCVQDLYECQMPAKQKADALYHKLIEQLQHTKRVDIELVTTKKKRNFTIKTKDNLIIDISNERAMKKKLEECCRELQKQNRSMRDEFNAASAAENAKREELKEKLHTTLGEVTKKHQESDAQKCALAEENETQKNKILELRDSAIARDVEYKTALQQKSIELQICKAQLEHKTVLSGFELSTQLTLYKDKFFDFQSTLDQSNEAFGTLKNELQKLSDLLAAEQAKTAELRTQSDSLDIETIELLTGNEVAKKDIESLSATQAQLKAECATLLSKNK